jgi:polyisoprenoid-binding protein YceI
MHVSPLRTALLAVALQWLPAATLNADTYLIDTDGMHASIQFRIQHLGYSWLYGRFNAFSGSFSYDAAQPEASWVKVTINTASIDSNHAKRDKHLRDEEFLDVSKYPEATFASTGVQWHSADALTLSGQLTLRGVTRDVVIEATKVGSGPDPWGGFRVGFSGTTRIALKDFGIDKYLGPASTTLELLLDIEGIRQDPRKAGKRS